MDFNSGLQRWEGMLHGRPSRSRNIRVGSLLDAEEALVGLVTSLSHSQKKQSTSDMVTQRFKDRLRFHHFRAWGNYVAKRRFNNRIVMLGWIRRRRVLGRYTMKHWYQAAVECARKRKRLRRCMMHWKNAELKKAMLKLKENVQHAMWRQNTVRRVLLKCAAILQTVAFTEWRRVCGEQKRYRHLIQKSSLARGLHATAKYMIAWKTECSSASRNQKKMLKFVKGLMNRQIKGALNIWLEILHDKQRRDRLLRKALMKVKMRLAASAFGTWLELIEDKRNKMLKMEQILRRALNRTLSMAYTHWKDLVQGHVREAKAIKHAVLIAWSRQCGVFKKHRVAYMRIAKRMKYGVAFAVFEAWVTYFRSQRRTRAVLTKTFMRMMRRALFGAFNQWASTCSKSRRQALMLDKFARRMKHGAAIQAIQTWHAAAIDGARKELLVQRALMKIKNREMASAWWQWCQLLDDAKRLDSKEHKVIMRWIRGMELWAFSVFRENWKASKMNNSKAAKFVADMLQRGLISSWKRLKANVAEHKMLVKKLDRLVKHWALRGVSVSFRSWQAVVVETITQRLEWAWGMWYEMHQDEIALKKKMRFAWLQALKRVVRATFKLWKDTTRAAMLHKARIAEALGMGSTRMDKHRQERIVGSWVSFTLKGRRRKIADGMYFRKLIELHVTCFFAWHEAARRIAHKRVMLGRLVGRVYVRVSFRMWQQYLYRKKQKHILIQVERAQEALRAERDLRIKAETKVSKLEQGLHAMKDKDSRDLKALMATKEDVQHLSSAYEQKYNKLLAKIKQRDEYIHNLCEALQAAEETKESLTTECEKERRLRESCLQELRSLKESMQRSSAYEKEARSVYEKEAAKGYGSHRTTRYVSPKVTP